MKMEIETEMGGRRGEGERQREDEDGGKRDRQICLLACLLLLTNCWLLLVAVAGGREI